MPIRPGRHQARSVTTVLLSATVALAAITGPTLVIADTAHAATPAAAPTTWGGNAANTLGGKDYYVDATAGSDTASGTSPTTAWKSLTKVNATTFAPGDRILLKAGDTWNDQQLWPKGSGAAGRPITIDAYGTSTKRPYIATNGKVQSPLNADGTKNPATVGLTGAVNLRNQQYWTVTDLELSNDDDFSTDIVGGQVVRDGVSVTINADVFPAGTAAADTVMHGITITNLDVHDIDVTNSWNKIYSAGVDFQIFGSKQYGDYAAGGYHFEDVSIQHNTFLHVELNAIQFGFNWFGDAQGETDSTGKYHEGWEQLWIRDRNLYNLNVTISHNYAEDIGQGVYQFAGTKNLTAEYNEGNGWLKRYSGVSAGIYLWAGADSVMRYNEIYGGPANQYDATPLDLEFTNFNVTYEYNYTHDNQGGWMSYMGNSGNSVARYNLSVNDNGVIWKNMLSSNYSPTYVANNVFVYDGSKLASFHDAVLKDRVYFLNNVFYNSSTTAPTTWATQPGALDKGMFSNNDYYEASGKRGAGEPTGTNAITADPHFVDDPATYAKSAGVDAILDSAARFAVKSSSPLIDAGRYNAHLGTTDFFGNPNYRGTAPDIGIAEQQQGATVTNPTDTNPIENEGIDTRTDLALDKPVTASSQHAGANLVASNLTDGDDTTRWAADDAPTYPLTIDIDFGKATTLNEVDLSEYTDAGTNPRIASFDLQQWDPTTSTWSTFTSGNGVGTKKVVDGFGDITTSKLRLSINGLLPGETYGPTLSEIRVFGPTAATNPTVAPAARTYDRSSAAAGTDAGTARFDVTLDGDTLQTVNYVTPAGAIVQPLGSSDATTTTEGGVTHYTITPAFLADKALGNSGFRFSFASGKTVTTTLTIIDSSALRAAVSKAKDVRSSDTAAYRALQARLADASTLLGTIATGTDPVTQAAVDAAADALTATLADATSAGGSGGTGTGPTTGTGGSGSSGGPGTKPVVTTTASVTPTGSLAFTGADLTGAAIAAALLASAGIALTIWTRRRRRTTVR